MHSPPKCAYRKTDGKPCRAYTCREELLRRNFSCARVSVACATDRNQPTLSCLRFCLILLTPAPARSRIRRNSPLRRAVSYHSEVQHPLRRSLSLVSNPKAPENKLITLVLKKRSYTMRAASPAAATRKLAGVTRPHISGGNRCSPTRHVPSSLQFC